ncbi:hypothetical protein [Lysinibacillus fusiformis]|uniref:hypothetical protein n=1 Tax=Lysinibacillus fusiformis TaxID=28031 RepID=UPI00380A2CAF
MENSIEIAFNEIIDEQIHQVAYEKCINDPEYQAANTKAITLMEMLRITLYNDEQRKLLNELESALFMAGSFFLEYSYRQGIEDSSIIYNELNLLGINVTKESKNVTI